MLLRAYASGYFPMAPDAGSDRLEWFDPPLRGIIPLESFHLPRRLRRTILAGGFEVRIDYDFDGVMAGCAAPAPGREETWISGRIRALYGALHGAGHAHSVEIWRDGALAGGLYGVSLGGAFFGESMFSRSRDVSKIALAYLVALLQHGGFSLLDTQFGTEHLARFGCIEIPAADYRLRLAGALAQPVPWPGTVDMDVLRARIGEMKTQTGVNA
jgi:leucyl/phenylalanyl-tRNA--protein transferase